MLSILTDSFLSQHHWLWAFFLNFVLIALVQRIPILTKAGWVNAGFLGTILWGCFGWKGWLAVVIYLALGYTVTKVGFDYKQLRGIAEGRGGLRGPENVWGSAAVGTILAISCQFVDTYWDYIFFAGFAASFAAKLADTFGSEIGKRWGKRTFLVTSFKSVPPGTDGAVSFEGTLASFFGSFIMTYAMYKLGFVINLTTFLIVLISGFVATIAESFIGAVFQRKFIWLTNELVNTIQTAIAAFISMTVIYFL